MLLRFVVQYCKRVSMFGLIFPRKTVEFTILFEWFSVEQQRCDEIKDHEGFGLSLARRLLIVMGLLL